MANKIQIARGLSANLPKLDAGEFGFTTDTLELYIGDSVNNHKIVFEDGVIETSINLANGVLGSVPYQTESGKTSFVSPNILTTKKFLSMTGDGTKGAAPVWSQVDFSDITGKPTTLGGYGIGDAYTKTYIENHFLSNTTDTFTGTLTVSGYIDINNSSTRIYEGSGNAIRLKTNSGYVDIGPQNTSHAHIYTDRSNFYFNKELLVLGYQVHHNNYHPYADKWTNPRKITLSNDASGNVSFDGSSDITLSVTVNNSANSANSDKLDSLDSSQFLRSDTSDTATGLITFSGGIRTDSINNATGQQLILNAGESSGKVSGQTNEFVYVNAESGLSVNTPDSSHSNWESGYTVKTTVIKGDSILINGNKVWHKGNDGPGSLLNADKLDDLDSSDFIRRVYINGYDGLATYDGGDTNWIRTTKNGIIPYASGGYSSLGTPSWPFSNIYANNIYDNGTLLENKYLGKTAKAADSDKLDGYDSSHFQVAGTYDNYGHWNLSVNSGTPVNINSGTQVDFKDGSNVTITRSGTTVTINATDTNTTYSAGSGLSLSGTQFSLSKATSSTLGGVKIGYTQNGRYYPVRLSSNDQMYVYVPWTDTNTQLSNSQVINMVLSGFTVPSSTSNVTASDSIIEALQKLEKRVAINDGKVSDQNHFPGFGTASGQVWGASAHPTTIAGYGITDIPTSLPASGGTSSSVTIHYNNNSNSNYQLLWGSVNNVYGTAGVTINPYTNTLRADSIGIGVDPHYELEVDGDGMFTGDLNSNGAIWSGGGLSTNGSMAITGSAVVGPHTSGSIEQVSNVMYGTTDPPTGTFKEGTIYIQY